MTRTYERTPEGEVHIDLEREVDKGCGTAFTNLFTGFGVSRAIRSAEKEVIRDIAFGPTGTVVDSARGNVPAEPIDHITVARRVGKVNISVTGTRIP